MKKIANVENFNFDDFEDDMPYWDPELLDENYGSPKPAKGRHRNKSWRKPRESDPWDDDQ